MGKVTYITLVVIINVAAYFCIPILLDYLHGVGLNSILIRGLEHKPKSQYLTAALSIIIVEWIIFMCLIYYLNRQTTQTWLYDNSTVIPLVITVVTAILTAVKLIKRFSYLIDQIRS